MVRAYSRTLARTIPTQHAIHVANEYRSRTSGVGHGGETPPASEVSEARLIVNLCASALLFLVELESALDVAAPRFLNAVGGVTTPPRGSCRRISIMNVTLPFVEILDHSQRLLVIMTMNSLVPAFADHQFCA